MSKGNLLWTLSLLIMVGCGSQITRYERIENMPMLGTFANIIADLPCDSVEVLRCRAMELNAKMNAEMSIFDSTSRISRVNRGQETLLSEDIIYNITLADSISRLSDGLYDITVMPLVEAWGFASRQAEQSPNVDSLLEFVGYDKIAIKDGHLIKQDPRIRLDFNSIAKGYTVDKLACLVESLGAQNYLVDIGGEIVCRGKNEKGQGWRVGIESPVDGDMVGGNLQRVVSIESDNYLRAVATSGNYRRFYIDDKGRKICHTIDSRTGKSKTSTLLSATVLAPSCALADALATMFMAAGDSLAFELLKRVEGVEVYFILSGDEQDYREYMTPAVTDMVIR